VAGFCCLFQAGLELLLLFVLLLYFLALLFKHLSISLENIGKNEKRHDNTEEKQKKFFFCLYIVNLGTIMGSSDKLNRTSKTQF